MSAELEAWEAACAQLRDIGLQLAARTDETAAAEIFEHLVDQATVWLNWETLHADPSRPFFHRHNDLVSQWGGPNADNVYRHARIEPGRRYAIRGDMHSCDEFLLAIRAGFMHQPVWGTLEQCSATDLKIGPGEEFEILLGGDAPGAIPIPDGAIMASIREYYFDWTTEEPAFFTIECLDPEPAAVNPPLGDRLTEALAVMTDSLEYWHTYMVENRSDRIDNTYESSTVAPAKGLAAARYEFCFWDLAEDEALIIETDVPDARYWSATLYMMSTFELVDWYGAITSRNHRQSAVSTDGRVRFVVAAQDAGVGNWLDTTGRQTGLCTLRWFWPHSETRPSISTNVVAVTDVGAALGANGRPVTAAERAEELASRQAHLRSRFRA
ncbi:MAG: hypothetical protein P8J50_10995 [Acidimicrobiales bacterium]|nr:hypothetical protein [Acidimicrobiales bacterium]